MPRKSRKIGIVGILVMCLLFYFLVQVYHDSKEVVKDDGYWSDTLLCNSDVDCEDYCYTSQMVELCYGMASPSCLPGIEVDLVINSDGSVNGTDAYCMPRQNMDALYSVEPYAGICRCRYLP